LDIADYLHIFRRYARTIVIATLATTLVAFAVALILPAQYRATSLLYVTAEAKDSTLFELSQVSMQHAASYPELATSADVLAPVRDTLGLRLTLDQLAGKVRAVNPTGTLFVSIDATDANPRLAARIANEVGRSLTTQARALETAASAEGTVRLTTATSAVPPTSTDAPVKPLAVGLGVLLGLVIGATIAIVRDRQRDAIPAAETLASMSGLDVLGWVNRRSPERKRSVDPAHRELSLALLKKTGGELPKVLVLVPVPDTASVRRGIRDFAEGFTSAGRTVLLVESGSGAPSEPGLAELLAGTTDTDTLLPASQATPNRLRLISAGNPDAVAERRGLATRAQSVLRQLRRRADITMVVATEISLPADTAVFARSADAVVVFAALHAGIADELRQASEELAVHGIQPIGIVLGARP
jgi:capsular polysaccharide biosynthesis protein